MTAPAHLAPRDHRRSPRRVVAGALVVVALGTGTVVALGGGDDDDVDPRCDLAMHEVHEVRAYWDVADDRGLSDAQVSQARSALHAADDVAARCGEGDPEVASAPTTTVESTTATSAPVATEDVLWHADADADADAGTTTRFWRKEVASEDMSRLQVVDDPAGQFQKVYEAHLTPAEIEGGFKRAEFAQALLGDGSTKLRLGVADTPLGPTENIWFGWRSLFGTDVAIDEDHSNDGNYMQLKGDSSCGGPAIGMTIKFGRLTLRSEQHLEEYDHAAWNGPQMATLLGAWHSVVLHVQFSKDASVGYLEVWFDGRRQIMSNGEDRIYFPTVCPDDTYVYPKLGVYGMDDAIGDGPQHWFDSPRIGTSYEAVVPR
jgi:hypothetical protein